jgi:hypothetical protein
VSEPAPAPDQAATTATPDPAADAAAAELERVRRVFPPLRAAALAYRPDWNPDELRDAMTAAHTAGWPLERIYARVYELTRTPDGEPRDLAEAAKKPTVKQTPSDPHAGADLARAQLATRRSTAA